MRTQSLADLFRPMVEEHDRRARALYDDEVEKLRRKFGEERAQQRGLEGTKAEYFVFGFCGHPAKQCDPKRYGCLDAFKAGKAAWQDADVQRAFRVACIKIPDQSKNVRPFGA